MRKKNKRGRHEKKSKKRISKSKLLIVGICLLLFTFGITKVFKAVSSNFSTAKDNVDFLITTVFGEDEDTSEVNKDKQFDLEEENEDIKKKYVVYLDVGHGGTDGGYKTKSGVYEKDLDLQTFL